MADFDSRKDTNRFPKGYSKLSGLNTPKGLADGTLGTIPPGTNYAEILCEGQDVRFRDDGPDPTGTDGLKLAAGMGLMYHESLSAIRFVEISPSATLHISFYA
jgi:hypothetical protein